MKSLGIDIGTTTISAAVIDAATDEVITTRTVSNDSFIETASLWEKIQDPDMICKKVFRLADGFLDEYEDIGTIGLTGQMHGIVYVDRVGECTGPLYTWQDERGDQSCFGGRSICEILREDCGVRAYPGYGLVTHLYNKKRGEIPEGAVTFCTIMDYIGMKMTGRKCPLVHSSNAASLGLFDVKKRKFREELLREAGIESAFLPEVTDELRCLGRYRGRTVGVAIGDNQASFLGAAEDTERTILLNMGTGGQVSVSSNLFLEADGIEARPFLPGKYLLVGASLCGGRSYAMLERFFRLYAEEAGMKNVDHYAVMERLLDKSGKESELKVSTTFSGTRDEPWKRGGIGNISVENFTPENLIRGFLEGMTEELYSMYKEMEMKLESEERVLVLSGNGFRKNRPLREIAEEKFGMRAVLAASCEEAACGAAKAGSDICGGEV